MKIITVLSLFTLLLFSGSCVVKQVERRPNIVVIKKAPRNYQVVTVRNKRYYKWGGKYYRKTKKGYVIVKI